MIIKLSATDIVAKIKSGELTAVEVAQAFIERIQQVNPAINAIHQFDPERILRDARAKDAAQEAGKSLGPLHGLPISLKDGFYVPGFKCAKGNKRLYELATGEQSSTAVDRLIAAGAIILGITNVPENLAASETDNLIHGRTLNPYNKDLTAGGSSGGEAALIACGGSCVGLGSDAAGSVRIPAAYCGITALKPTKGLVPLTGLIPADVGALKADCSMFGPMARYVEDLELFLQVIHGPDDKDPACAPVPLQSMHDVDAKQLKAKYFIDAGLTPTCPGVHRSIQAAVDALGNKLQPVESVTPPEILKDSYKLVYETCYLEGNKGERYDAGIQKINQTEFSPLYKQYLKQVHRSEFSNAELHNRINEIYQYKRAMFDLMGDADILLCPTTPTPAREHGTTHDTLNDFEYTMISNLTGWPAASVYCGDDKYGMPIGLQIIGKPWQDHKVLAYAKAAQALFGVPEVVTPND